MRVKLKPKQIVQLWNDPHVLYASMTASYLAGKTKGRDRERENDSAFLLSIL